VAIRVIWEINPYFLFYRGTQIGAKGRGQAANGGPWPLALPWRRPWSMEEEGIREDGTGGEGRRG